MTELERAEVEAVLRHTLSLTLSTLRLLLTQRRRFLRSHLPPDYARLHATSQTLLELYADIRLLSHLHRPHGPIDW